MNEGARMNRLFGFAWILSVLGAAATGCTLESACKSDFDGDGINDCEDPCPMLQDTLKNLGLSSGDALNQRIAESEKCSATVRAGLSICTDTDQDGIIDCLDVCELSPYYGEIRKADSKFEVKVYSDDEVNSKYLTCTGEELDRCPNDDSKTVPGLCGCGVSDPSDYDDGDKRVTCSEQPSQWCPYDSEKQTTGPGVCGCGYKDPQSGRVEDCNNDAQDGYVVIGDTATLVEFYRQVQEHIKSQKCERNGDDLVCRGEDNDSRCSGDTLKEGGEENACCDENQYIEKCDGDVAYTCFGGKVHRRDCSAIGGCSLFSLPQTFLQDTRYTQLAFCNADNAPEESYPLKARIVNDIDLCDDATVMGEIAGFFEVAGAQTVVYPDLDLYGVDLDGNNHTIRCSYSFARPLFNNVVKSRIRNLSFEFNMVQRPAAVIARNLYHSSLVNVKWNGSTDLGNSQNDRSNAESFGGIAANMTDSVLNGVHADYDDLRAYKDGGVPDNGFMTSGMFNTASHSLIKDSGSKIWKYRCSHRYCAAFGGTLARSYVTQSYQNIDNYQFTQFESDDFDALVDASGFVDSAEKTVFHKIYNRIHNVKFSTEKAKAKCIDRSCLFSGFSRYAENSWLSNVKHEIDNIELEKWGLYGFVHNQNYSSANNQFENLDLIFDHMDVSMFVLMTSSDSGFSGKNINVTVKSPIRSSLASASDSRSSSCDLVGEITGNVENINVDIHDIDIPNCKVRGVYVRNSLNTLKNASIRVGSMNVKSFSCFDISTNAENISCEVGESTLENYTLLGNLSRLRNASAYSDIYIQEEAVNNTGCYSALGDIGYGEVNTAYNKGAYIADRVVTTALLHSYDRITRSTDAAGTETRIVIGTNDLNGPYVLNYVYANNCEDDVPTYFKDVYKNTYWYKPITDAFSVLKTQVQDSNDNNTYVDCPAETTVKLRNVVDSMSFTKDTAADLIENLKSQDPGWGSKEIDIRVNNYPEKLIIPWYNVDTSWVGEMKKEMDAWIAKMPIDNGTK